mgnify:CR=1 FL=1
MECEAEAKRLADHFEQPLAQEELCNHRPSAEELQDFFAPIPLAQVTPSPKKTTKHVDVDLVKDDLPSIFATAVKLVELNQRLRSRQVPFPMLAFAKCFSDHCIPKRDSSGAIQATEIALGKNEILRSLIPPHTLKLVVPAYRVNGEPLEPKYHSIEGQELYYLDWEMQFRGLALPCCFQGECSGRLVRDRTNLSKHGRLFPLFKLDGPPAWCIVQQYYCSACKKSVKANDSTLLMSLPLYVRNTYPVDTRYAGTGKTYHVSRSITTLLNTLMPTYGNGDLIARLMKRAIDDDYLCRLQQYLSFWKMFKEANKGEINAPPYINKDVDFLTLPPTGSDLRDLFDEACNSTATPYGISDHDRCTREIQSVTTNKLFAQDHTMEVVKNYQKSDVPGAFAVWDACTETGEIASAVMVGNTSVRDIAHAAEQLARRPGFNPKAMYSDTWPNKEAFWKLLFGNHLKGRLGLFHFMQRIIRTLRQGHADYHVAVQDLSAAVYRWETKSYEALITAMKEGLVGNGKKKYTDEEIVSMEMTPQFKKTYQKYLMKEIHAHKTIERNLENWFIKYKVNASEGKQPGRGRLDPRTGKTLFTVETKTVVEEQKRNAANIGDPGKIEDMYRIIKPTVSTRHNLNEYISLRAESKLEGFHNPLSNFGNTAMRQSLCDNLNLRGTAAYNVVIRHRILMGELSDSEKPRIPSYWANYPSFDNHSLLQSVNNLAKAAGVVPPFSNLRQLPENNGESFFSEYWMQEKQRQLKIARHPLNDRCHCDKCALNDSRETVATIETEDISNGHEEKTVNSGQEQEVQVRPVAQPIPIVPVATMQNVPNPMVIPHQFSPHFVMQQQHCINIQMQALANWQYWQAQGQTMVIHQPVRPKTQHQLCCPKYVEYRQKPNSKGGRPPHSKDCPLKMQNKR